MGSKLKWTVAEAPTGPYRSFQRRGWPTATLGGKTAFLLRCEDDYVPAQVRTGEHAELRILVADRREKTVGWDLRILRKRAATLDEAKRIAQAFADANPTFFVNKKED